MLISERQPGDKPFWTPETPVTAQE